MGCARTPWDSFYLLLLFIDTHTTPFATWLQTKTHNLQPSGSYVTRETNLSSKIVYGKRVKVSELNESLNKIHLHKHHVVDSFYELRITPLKSDTTVGWGKPAGSYRLCYIYSTLLAITSKTMPDGIWRSVTLSTYCIRAESAFELRMHLII